MADGIDIDGAGTDMFPPEATAVVADISAAGTTFRQNWLGKLGEIAALDSQLGKGPMGRQFAADYIPSVRRIVDAVDELGRRIEERARFGNYAINEYITTDQHNAERFKT